MSSVDQLLLILLLIYVSECLLYLRDGADALGSWLGRQRVLSERLPVGRSGGGLMLLSPLPWEIAFVCEAWPVAASEEGLLSIAGWPGNGAAGDEVGAIAWDDVQALGADGRWLKVNGAPYAECGSAAMAAHLSKTLKKVRTADAADRRKVIREALTAALDPKPAGERWNIVRGSIQRLRVGGTAMFITMFLVVPVADRMLPIWSWAPWLLAAVVLQAMGNMFGVARVVRACGELTPEERFKTKLVSIISPVASTRSAQMAGTHLFPLHHPLTVAVVLGPERFARECAGQFWRELNFPRLPVDAASDSLAARIFASHTALQIEAMRRMLESCQIEPAALLDPPTPDGQDVAAYCPRCLGQYQSLGNCCHTCGGRELLPLAGSQ